MLVPQVADSSVRGIPNDLNDVLNPRITPKSDGGFSWVSDSVGLFTPAEQKEFDVSAPPVTIVTISDH